MAAENHPLNSLDAEGLEAHWMPFTGNRNFKSAAAHHYSSRGAYYTSHDGRKIFDGLSGLWCCGLGHGRQEITDAAQRQLATLDYSPAFQFGHPLSFELANKIKALTPAGLDYVFFTGSGSEAADTSLKMARAYWRAKGEQAKPALSAGKRAITALTSAVSRSAASPATARRSAPPCGPPAAHPAGRQRLSRGMPQQGQSWRKSSTASSRCATPQRSPR